MSGITAFRPRYRTSRFSDGWEAKMSVLKVLEISGENAVAQEDGQKVYELVREGLKSGHEVHLDFQGVNIFASPFFNAAVGQLLRDFSADDLNRLLKFDQLSLLGQEVLKRVIENSKRYFSSSEGYRKAQTEVMESLARGH
jgi:STAS-like domain of unknown function (DUF4325)